MNLKNLLVAAMLVGAVFVSGVAGADAQGERATYMVEIIPLKHGASIEQAQHYFEAVTPIIAAHGVYAIQSYEVVGQDANAPARVVNVWRVARPNGLPEIFADPAYVAHVRERDAIFDLPGRVGWMTREMY